MTTTCSLVTGGGSRQQTTHNSLACAISSVSMPFCFARQMEETKTEPERVALAAGWAVTGLISKDLTSSMLLLCTQACVRSHVSIDKPGLNRV